MGGTIARRLDFNLPGMDGLHLTELMSRRSELRGTVMMMLTSGQSSRAVVHDEDAHAVCGSLAWV